MVSDSQDHNDTDGSVDDRRAGETEEQAKSRKRKERLEQNRISARESRKRKKTMIEELQRTVIALSRENKELNERNETLRRQLMEIGNKYPNIVPLQAIVGQGAAQAPSSEQQAAATAAAQSATAGGATAATPAAATTAAPAAPPAPVAGAASGLAAFNPMAWLGTPAAAANSGASGQPSA